MESVCAVCVGGSVGGIGGAHCAEDGRDEGLEGAAAGEAEEGGGEEGECLGEEGEGGGGAARGGEEASQQIGADDLQLLAGGVRGHDRQHGPEEVGLGEVGSTVVWLRGGGCVGGS